MKKNSPALENKETKPVFDCKRCGHCCFGEGGIVVGPRDLPRLCAELGLDAASFIARYTYERGGKIKIRSTDNKYCVFFVPGKGCSVHEAKPDICRAWPFFRGNLVDSASLALAKEFCPGIAADIKHDDFVREGLHYLEEHSLTASDPIKEANALMVLP